MTDWPSVTRDCKRCGRPFTQELKQGHPFFKCEVCRDPAPPRTRPEEPVAAGELDAEGSQPKAAASPSLPRRVEPPSTPEERLRRLRSLRGRLQDRGLRDTELYKQVCARIVDVEAGADAGIRSSFETELRQVVEAEGIAIP